MERWSLLGAPRKRCLCAGEEPEDHKRLSIRLDRRKKGRVAIPVDNKILTMVEPAEVELLAPPPTQAPGNRVQGGALSFQILAKKVQLTQLCEQAFFPHLVIARNC